MAGVPMEVEELDLRIKTYDKSEIEIAVEYMDCTPEYPLDCTISDCSSCILTSRKEALEKVEEIRKDFYNL